MKEKALLHRFAALAACFAFALALAGCGGGGGSDTAAAATPQAAPSATESYSLRDEAGFENTAAAPAGGAEQPQGRKLITNADVSVDATDFSAATAAVEQQVAALGGYLASSRREGSEELGHRTAWYEARIPADQLDSFLSAVGNAGTVTSTSRETMDVTADYVDNEARLATLQAQEARLLELTAQAGQLEDLLALEEKLADVRYEIEGITGQQRLYDNLIAFCTVSLTIHEVTQQTITSPSFLTRVGRAFAGSFENFVNAAQDLIITLIYLLPLLLFLALVAVAAWLICRAVRRRRAARPKPPFAPPPVQPVPPVPGYPGRGPAAGPGAPLGGPVPPPPPRPVTGPVPPVPPVPPAAPGTPAAPQQEKPE